MLIVSRLSKRFPGVQALDGVDLEVRGGEVHALVGENGAGKSTLVKILGGGVVPDAGTILLDGRSLGTGDPLAARRAGVAVIYQELMLVPELAVWENVFLGRERQHRGWLGRDEMIAATTSVLHRLAAPIDPRATVRDLSVGLRQLVEIARALHGDAKLLIFDEPSATLTDKELSHLFDVIAQLRAAGMAIIYISHRLEEIFRIADRVTVLRDGVQAATANVTDVDRNKLVEWMVGREVREVQRGGRPPARDVLLALCGLSCPPRFHDVSLSLRAGEVLGMAGLVGAGRTSVALAVYGALQPTGGRMVYRGAAVAFGHPRQALEAGIGYLTEDRKERGIFAELSVGENITVSSLEDYRRVGLVSWSRARATAERACRRFDVRTTGIDKKIAALSGGNQQKALLARLRSHALEVLILDEPTRGVDIGARAQVHEMIHGIAGDGVAVMLVSSDLPELMQVCDRICIMCEGRTTGVLTREEATQERIMHLATQEAAA